jgi:hypothetical protein
MTSTEGPFSCGPRLWPGRVSWSAPCRLSRSIRRADLRRSRWATEGDRGTAIRRVLEQSVVLTEWKGQCRAAEPIRPPPSRCDPPGVVVAVLSAAPGVDTGCLDVAIRCHADPHVLPGGRQDQRLDAGEHDIVGDPVAVGIEVDEASTRPTAGVPRSVTIRSAQPGHACAIPGRRGRQTRLARRTHSRPRPSGASLLLECVAVRPSPQTAATHDRSAS